MRLGVIASGAMKHRLAIFEASPSGPPKPLRSTYVEGDTVDDAREAAKRAVVTLTGRTPRSFSCTVDGGFSAVVPPKEG